MPGISSRCWETFPSIKKKTPKTSCLQLPNEKWETFLVGGFNPSEKYARQIGFIFPNFRGENKKYLSCHHLVSYVFQVTRDFHALIHGSFKLRSFAMGFEKIHPLPDRPCNSNYPPMHIPEKYSGWPLVVGNEGPSTFTGWYIGDETSRKFPTSRAS